jgi:hypothetical protein
MGTYQTPLCWRLVISFRSSLECAHMSEVVDELFCAFEKLQVPSTFAVGDTWRPTLPGIEVQGVGPVCLPIVPDTAEKLISVAKHAPFGKGFETVVDLTVRKCWQIGTQFKFWSFQVSISLQKLCVDNQSFTKFLDMNFTTNTHLALDKRSINENTVD